MTVEHLAPRIPPHHRIQVSGTLGRQPGQPQANPIFQIDTLTDDGTWSRRATGYSTMARVHEALRTCQCVRCELDTLRRTIHRLERDIRVLQAVATGGTTAVATRRRKGGRTV